MEQMEQDQPQNGPLSTTAANPAVTLTAANSLGGVGVTLTAANPLGGAAVTLTAGGDMPAAVFQAQPLVLGGSASATVNPPPPPPPLITTTTPTPSFVATTAISSNSSSTTTDNLNSHGANNPPLSDLMVQLEDYIPTIPDSVTSHYLATAGFDTADPRLLRLVSIAAQKFVSDVANDALTHCKMRQANIPAKKTGGKDRKFVMTSEDLSSALGEQGVTVRRPPFYQ